MTSHIYPNAPTIADLKRVIAGDVAGMRMLVNQSDVSRVGEEIPEQERTLRPSAVKRVLKALLERSITPKQANVWAWFVRSGHVPGSKEPVRSLSINYQEDCDEPIAEAVSRLTELGDVIDGTIDDDELRKLIADLSKGDGP